MQLNRLIQYNDKSNTNSTQQSDYQAELYLLLNYCPDGRT